MILSIKQWLLTNIRKKVLFYIACRNYLAWACLELAVWRVSTHLTAVLTLQPPLTSAKTVQLLKTAAPHPVHHTANTTVQQDVYLLSGLTMYVCLLLKS